MTHYTTEVYVDNVEFCGGKNDSSTNVQNTQNTQTAQPAAQPAGDDSGLSYGNLSEFDEILSDGDVPF